MSPPAANVFRSRGSEAQVDRGCDNVAFDLCTSTVGGFLIEVVDVPAHAGTEAARCGQFDDVIIGGCATTNIGFTEVAFETNSPGTGDVIRHTNAQTFLIANAANTTIIVLGIACAECEAADADRCAKTPGLGIGECRVTLCCTPTTAKVDIDAIERLAVADADVDDVADRRIEVYRRVVRRITSAAGRVGHTEGQAVEGRREIGDALNVVVAANFSVGRQSRLTEAARPGNRNEGRGRTRVDRHGANLG